MTNPLNDLPVVNIPPRVTRTVPDTPGRDQDENGVPAIRAAQVLPPSNSGRSGVTFSLGGAPTEESVASQSKLTRSESSIDPVSRVTSSGPTQLQEIAINTVFKTERALLNPLDNFIDVTYNFSLGIVNKEKTIEIQKASLSGANLGKIPSPKDVMIFASTGESKSNTPDLFNYLAIKKVSFTNLMSATPQNPMLTPMYDIKIDLVEPYGFRLNEQIRTMGRQLGWGNVVPGRYTYELKLWFSGYDPTTGQWTERIKLNQFNGVNFDTFVVYVSIPNLEGRVTPSGAEYSLTCVPVSQFAFRSSDYTLAATSITTGSSRTFGGLLNALAAELEAQKKNASNDILNHEYEFICPKYLADAEFKVGERTSFLQKRNQNSESDLYTQVADNIPLRMFLQNALDGLELVQKQTVQGDSNNSFLNPTIRYSIRTNAIFIENDDKIGDFKKIKFQYIVEPHVSFYRGYHPLEGREDLVALKNQISRADKMLSLGMVHRVYDFYFSSGNSEVLKFDFNFNRFFSEMIDPIQDNLSTRSLTTKETPNQTATRNKQDQTVNTVRVVNSQTDPNESSQTRVNRLLGNGNQTSQTARTFDSTDKIGSHSGISPRSESQIVSSSEADELYRKYKQASDLYVRYEMIKGELEVRGDPIWMFNPYMAEGDASPTLVGEVFSTKNGASAKLKAYTDRYLFLRAYSPTQSDYMNPGRTSASSEPTLLGGFYQAIKVNSLFSEGKYTQTIDCVKVPHMNYVIDAMTQINNTKTTEKSGADPIVSQNRFNRST